MNTHVSLDSRARHSVFTAIYEAAQPRRTEAERERAILDAHEAAERAMRGLDDALLSTAEIARARFRSAGVPGHIADQIADEVHRCACRVLLETARR